MSKIHYSEVKTSVMASQITSLTIVYTNVDSGADQRKRQSSTSLAVVMGIHRWPMNSPHKGPVTWIFSHLMTSSWWFIYFLHEHSMQIMLQYQCQCDDNIDEIVLCISRAKLKTVATPLLTHCSYQPWRNDVMTWTHVPHYRPFVGEIWCCLL